MLEDLHSCEDSSNISSISKYNKLLSIGVLVLYLNWSVLNGYPKSCCTGIIFYNFYLTNKKKKYLVGLYLPTSQQCNIIEMHSQAADIAGTYPYTKWNCLRKKYGWIFTQKMRRIKFSGNQYLQGFGIREIGRLSQVEMY